jgi:hypothetical protein
MKSLELVYTHRSSENADYIYWANVIKDYDRVLNGKPSYFWFGDADNDVDGSPYWQHDPYGQAGTSLIHNGRPVNGDRVPFIVVPPQVLNMTPEIVLGCMGTMEYQDKVVSCVVADTGPKSKIGEASPAALRALGIPALQNGNGGLDTQEILYRIWPGVPAEILVDVTTQRFVLQKS